MFGGIGIMRVAVSAERTDNPRSYNLVYYASNAHDHNWWRIGEIGNVYRGVPENNRTDILSSYYRGQDISLTTRQVTRLLGESDIYR